MPCTIYALLTWTTLRRAPVITTQVAQFLERFLPGVGRRHGVVIIEIGVVADHVHVLMHLPPVFDVPRLVQGLKGASARVANRDLIRGATRLRWATGYDLRSVSPQALPAAMRYVATQSSRHPESAIPTADVTILRHHA